MRFAALGDSMTVGIGDAMPRAGFRGWATLLNAAFEDAELFNLAVNGARAADVVSKQLPAAVALRPSVASVVVGTNDTLRGQFNLSEVARDISC